MDDSLQNELRELLTEKHRNILRFDGLLGEHLEGLNGDTVSHLFDLFTDEPLFQDEMWSLVHLVESLPDPDYVKSLFESMRWIKIKAPEWSSILAIRVLNSESTRKSLKEQIASATNQDRDVWRDILLGIETEDASFSSVINQILPDR